MIRKLFTFIVLFIGCTFSVMSQNSLSYRGFSGGMMIHSGILESRQFNIISENGTIVSTNNVSGMPFGIGGSARLHFGKHLRVGGEGYVSNLRYGVKGTTSSTSWGGILVDCIWQFDKWWPFGGILVGGGAVEHIVLNNEPSIDFIVENNAAYREYAFMAIAPMVGVEYALNEKIHLTFKMDYVINISNPQDDFPSGPRFFLGFMFYRLDD